MKTRFLNIFFCAVSALMAFSCSNPEVDIMDAVQVVVSPERVLSSFNLYKETDVDFDKIDGYVPKIRITALLYDKASGNLISKSEGTVSDFANSYKFYLASTSGEKTLVCFSTVILGNLEKPYHEAYSITGEQSLSTLKVESHLNSYLLSFMGYSISNLNDEKSVNVSLQPGVALVYLRYENIHARDSKNVDKYMIWHHSNDIARVNGNSLSFSTTLTTDSSYNNSLEPADYDKSKYTNIYSLICLFPGTIKMQGSYNIGNNRTFFGEQNVTLKMGHQYVFNLDCTNAAMSFYEGELGSKSGLDSDLPELEKCIDIL